MSLAGTCSFFVNTETIQKSISPPANLKNVSVYGLSICGINVLEMGVLSPKIILAENMAICPLNLFFSILYSVLTKVVNMSEPVLKETPKKQSGSF